MLSGADVTAALGRFCSDTAVVGYVTNDVAVAALLTAGAASALTRRVPPAEAAQAFLALTPSADGPPGLRRSSESALPASPHHQPRRPAPGGLAAGSTPVPSALVGQISGVEDQSQAAARGTASDGSATDDQVCLELAATSSAPGLARGAAAGAVRRWQLPCLVDAVVLVVSELVTNAVRYGLPPMRLVLSRGAHGLRVEVHDQAHDAPPVERVARAVDESGRGMGIVQAVASGTGVEPTAGGGKAVYAVFDLPGPAH